MMRVALLLALIVATSASPRLFVSPHRTVWSGTVITNGVMGTLVARTHYTAGRDIDPHYPGRFHCRGPGCPFHHGNIDFIPDPRYVDTRIYEIFFGRHHPALYCFYDNDNAPPDFAIDGSYTCSTVVPPEPPPVRIVATGTMMLVASCSPQP